MYSEIVKAEGHLVDSQILSKIFDRVIECGAEFEVVQFDLGRTNKDFSRLQLKIIAPKQELLMKGTKEGPSSTSSICANGWMDRK